MPSQFERRLALVAAGTGVLAAVFDALTGVLRSDLVSPLGALPPVVARTLALVTGPVLALYLGSRLSTAGEHRRLLGLPFVLVALGGLLGTAVGTVAGEVLWWAVITLPDPVVALPRATRRLVPFLVVSGAIPVVLATLGGVALARRPGRSGPESDPSGRRRRLLTLAVTGGVATGFVTFVLPFTSVLGSGGAVLTRRGYAWVGAVAVPLVVMALAAALDDPRTPVGARQLLSVGGAALAGELVGYAFGYGAVAANRQMGRVLFLADAGHLTVEAVLGSVVVTVAVVAGMGLGAGDHSSSGG